MIERRMRLWNSGLRISSMQGSETTAMYQTVTRKADLSVIHDLCETAFRESAYPRPMKTLEHNVGLISKQGSQSDCSQRLQLPSGLMPKLTSASWEVSNLLTGKCANYCTHCHSLICCGNQRRDEVRWRPRQEASLAPPMFELELFRQKIYCFDTVGTFRRPRSGSAPGKLLPLVPTLVKPPLVTISFQATTHRIRILKISW